MTVVRKPFFVVPLDLGTITSTNEVAGHPASHLGRLKAKGLTWKTSGPTNAWARGDLGSAQEIDFCAILSANALPATTFRLRLGDSDAEVNGTADHDSTALPFISPSITRADGLYHSFYELPAAVTKQWWRIDIGSHTGDFEAAIVVLGKKIEPSRFYNTDFEFGTEDTGKAEITPYGVWDEEPGQILRTVDMTLEWLTAEEYEGDFRPMIEAVGSTQPVYLAFGPEAETYRQARTYYGKFRKPPYARGRRKPGLFGGEYQLLSIF